jgi:hypothetical protein
MSADSPHLEIVGLHSNSNGHSCCQHKCCGEHVKVGDVLRLVKCVVTINSQAEEAVKLVKIEDSTNCCTVSFVPRVFSLMISQFQNRTSLPEFYSNTSYK